MKSQSAKQLAINGGKPIRQKPWPSYSKGNSLITKKHLRPVIQVLQQKRFFRYDNRPFAATYSGKLEQSIQKYFSVNRALALNSGTSAIALGLLAAGIPAGSLVACPSFTFSATPSAILLANCKPLLIEVDENLHLDLHDLRKKYTPELKAIVPVHMRGMACDITAVMQFAKEKNLTVIEDAAAACGVTLNGKQLGTFGHAGAFSTQSDKFINAGEGGFLITDNEELFKTALVYSGGYVPGLYKHFSQIPEPKEFALNYPLYSFRIDEIRAALAYSQVADLNKNLAKQRAIYKRTIAKLQSYSQLHIRQPIAEDGVLGNKLVFRIPGISGAQASKFALALQAEGIDTWAFGDPHEMNQRVYWNWRFLFNNLAPEKIQASLPNSYQYISESIDIPLFAKLTKKDINDLICAIDKVLSNQDFLGI